MSLLVPPTGFAVLGTCQFVQVATAASALTSLTFSDVPIGAAHSHRTIVVSAVSWGSGDSARTWDAAGAGIGGAGATTLVTRSHDGSNQLVTAVMARAVAAGTTADITLAYTGGTVTYHSIAVYRAIGIASLTPIDTGTDSDSSATELDLSLNTPSRGLAIAAAIRDVDDDYPDWVGADLAAAVDGPAFSGSHAFASVTSASTPLTVTATGAGASAQSGCAVALSF